MPLRNQWLAAREADFLHPAGEGRCNGTDFFQAEHLSAEQGHILGHAVDARNPRIP